MTGRRVVVALSGGVDSAVAAALLRKQGCEVIGMSMHLWCEDAAGPGARQRSCCSADDLRDAEKVCQALDIPFYRLNMQQAFQTHVVDYFCAEYSRGLTPNPCIACNRHLKFHLLLEKARSLDAQLATGHYARIEQTPAGYRLLKARDRVKDQSYFLFTLGQSELPHLLFPVGDLPKSQVRAIAAEMGLPVADKAESQDLCFVPDGDYRTFLSHRLQLRRGDIVDRSRRTLGRHSGTALYTVGQRRGLDLSSETPLYVLALDAPANRVVVGPEEQLLQDEAWIDNLNWVSGNPPHNMGVSVKIRYQSPETAASLTPVRRPDFVGVKVRFREPQRAIAPGQAAVFYAGDEVLGGGIIRPAEPA